VPESFANGVKKMCGRLLECVSPFRAQYRHKWWYGTCLHDGVCVIVFSKGP
jgi:hypothetical protein